MTPRYMKSIIFCNVTQCTLIKVHRRFGRTPVDFYQSTRRHILDYSILHSHCRDNPKCNIMLNLDMFN
jgi:hypothetical protein